MRKIENPEEAPSVNNVEEALNKPGTVIDRWILRLGKNAEEAGKFCPWFLPSSTFKQDLESFLACLNLLKLHEAVKERMSEQKKGVREIKKQQRIEQKEIAKMKAKVEKAAAKAQLKLDRVAEKERIKAEAKATRETMKLSKADAKVFVEALTNPPEPNEALKAAALAYEEAVEHKPYVIPEEV